MTTKPKLSELERFLREPKNSHARESILNARLLYDLKLAAAQSGYFLNAYFPEVDHDGFDVIFDDGDFLSVKLSKIQLKTVMKGAQTSDWDIHKVLIRPTPYNSEKYGFACVQDSTGYEGGVILMEVDADQDLNIKYYYTDILIICAFRDGLFRMKKTPMESALNNFLSKLQNGSSNEKINIPKSMFLQAKDPVCLLALMRMPSAIEDGYYFQNMIIKLVQPYYKLPPAREENEMRELDRQLSLLSPVELSSMSGN